MTKLPSGLTTMKIDYGEPSWREPVKGVSNDEAGYAEFSHDGSHIWLRLDGGRVETEMNPRGARILADSLIAFAEMLE